MSTDDDQQRLNALRREIAAVRRERLDRTRAASRITTVGAAADAADRDADALTSPEVENLRTQVEQLTARLRDAWLRVDRHRLAWRRLEAAGIELDRVAHAEQLRSAFAAEAKVRDAATEAFAAARLSIDVPRPADVTVPLNPHRQELADLMADIAREQTAREVRRRQTTTRREPDRAR